MREPAAQGVVVVEDQALGRIAEPHLQIAGKRDPVHGAGGAAEDRAVLVGPHQMFAALAAAGLDDLASGGAPGLVARDLAMRD